MMSPVELAAYDEARAHAGPDRQEDEVLHSPGDTEPLLAERGEVDVVLERDRQLEPRPQFGAEGLALEPWNAGGEIDALGAPLDDTGDTDHDTVDAVGREPCRGDERVAEPRHHLEHVDDIGADHVHVLPRPDLAREVADRAAKESTAEVEAECEGGIRDRLEESGAIARADRLGGRFADEP